MSPPSDWPICIAAGCSTTTWRPGQGEEDQAVPYCKQHTTETQAERDRIERSRHRRPRWFRPDDPQDANRFSFAPSAPEKKSLTPLPLRP